MNKRKKRHAVRTNKPRSKGGTPRGKVVGLEKGLKAFARINNVPYIEGRGFMPDASSDLGEPKTPQM